MKPCRVMDCYYVKNLLNFGVDPTQTGWMPVILVFWYNVLHMKQVHPDKVISSKVTVGLGRGVPFTEGLLVVICTWFVVSDGLMVLANGGRGVTAADRMASHLSKSLLLAQKIFSPRRSYRCASFFFYFCIDNECLKLEQRKVKLICYTNTLSFCTNQIGRNKWSDKKRSIFSVDGHWLDSYVTASIAVSEWPLKCQNINTLGNTDSSWR